MRKNAMKNFSLQSLEISEELRTLLFTCSSGRLPFCNLDSNQLENIYLSMYDRTTEWKADVLDYTFEQDEILQIVDLL